MDQTKIARDSMFYKCSPQLNHVFDLRSQILVQKQKKIQISSLPKNLVGQLCGSPGPLDLNLNFDTPWPPFFFAFILKILSDKKHV